MKKKWTYLAVAGMLLGTAPVFTGCVDNDEPAGIEQLRGAKAQLLQAKAAVEEAKALVKQAQAEYKQAEAQRMRAWAAQAEYEAELKRLEVERAEAATEYEKVLYQEKIQFLQEQMEISAIQHQQEMLQNQYNLEYTKRQIELLMERLEIADAIGSEEVSVSISYLEQQVKKAYCVLYGGQWGPDAANQTIDEDEALYNIMVQAQEAVYNAMLNHSHGIITDDSKQYIAQLEYEVAKEQAKLEAEKKALEKVQNFMEEDVLTADWRAQIASLEDEIAEVKKNWDAAWVAQETAQNSGSYLEAKQKLYGIYSKDKPMGDLSIPTNIQVEGIVCEYPKASNALQAVQDGAYQTYIKAKRELKNLKKDEANIFTLAEGELTKGISANLNSALQAAEASLYGFSTLTWTNGISYDEMSYRYYDNANGADKVLGKVNVEEEEYPVTVDENGNEVTSGWTVAMLFQTIQKMELIIDKAEEDKLITTALETEFGALKTNLATAKTNLNAAFEKAYTDAFGTAEKALADAETALLTADAAMAAEEAKITDLKVEVAKWKDTYNAYTAIKDALVQAVNDNLTLGGNVKFDDTEGFELALSKEELRCQKAVANAEKLLADAQVELEKAQDGQYDDLTRAQHKLEVANYNYNQGLTDYQDALDDLNTALAAIADEEEGGNAEQPGDDNQDPAGEEEQPAE